MKECLLAFLLAGSTCASSAFARDIPLGLSDWQPVTFDGITPTLFRQLDTPDGEGIALTVESPSSFLVHAFNRFETYSRVS